MLKLHVRWRGIARALVYLLVTDAIINIRETKTQNMHVIAKMIFFLHVKFLHLQLLLLSFPIIDAVHVIDKIKNYFRVFLYNAAFFVTQK